MHSGRSLCSLALQLNLLWMDMQRLALLQSGNGTEFCAEVVKRLSEFHYVEFRQGAVGHPQSQVGEWKDWEKHQEEGVVAMAGSKRQWW